jgi:hypothetical protein
MYPKAKVVAENFCISLSGDGLEFFDGHSKKMIAYQNLENLKS